MRLFITLAVFTVMLAGSVRAQWTFVDSVRVGGMVSAVSIVCDSSDRLIAFSGSLYVYDAASRTWKKRQLPAAGSPFLAVMPSGRLLAASTQAMYYSDDAGITWNTLGRDFSASGATAIVWSDTAILVLGGTGSGMQVLTRSDSTWQQVPQTLSIRPTSAFVTNDGYFAVGTQHYLYRSKDPLHWSNLDSAELDVKIRKANVTERGTILALAQYSSALFRSNDWGKTWTTPLSLGGLNGIQSTISLKNDYFVATAGNAGFYISSDDGSTWRQVRRLSVLQPLAMAQTKRGDLVVTSTSGISRSTDNGVSWSSLDSGFSITHAQALGAIGDTVFASLTVGGEYRAWGSPLTWAESNDSLTGGVINYSIAGGKLYAVSGESIVRWNGASWSAYPNLFEDKAPVTYAISPSGRTFAGTATQFFYMPPDGGDWRSVLQFLGTPVKQTAVDSAGRIYALVGRDSIFYSTNDGDDWSLLTNTWTTSSVMSLSAIGDTLLVATTGGTVNGLYSTADLGANWVSRPFSVAGIRGVAAYAGRYFAYSTTLILEREAQQTAWTQTSEIPSTEGISAVSISPTGHAYLSTFKGLYSRQLPSAPRSVSAGHARQDILQIYPNPVSGMLRIDNSAEHYVLLNTLGQCVATAAEGSLDCSKYPAGVYELRAASGKSARLVIVR
jgi:hypothetical protein